MAGKKEHIGIVLHYDKPEDKMVIDLLNNLPLHETKCSFIRKAIISYGKNQGKESQGEELGDTDAKLDAIMDKLDMLLKEKEQITERKVEDHPSVPAPVSKKSEKKVQSKAAEIPVEKEQITAPVSAQAEDDISAPLLSEEDISVSTEIESIYDKTFQEALGDFLN